MEFGNPNGGGPLCTGNQWSSCLPRVKKGKVRGENLALFDGGFKPHYKKTGHGGLGRWMGLLVDFANQFLQKGSHGGFFVL